MTTLVAIATKDALVMCVIPIWARFTVVLGLSLAFSSPVSADGPYQATGVKVGEVDQTSAIVWTRSNGFWILQTGAEDDLAGLRAGPFFYSADSPANRPSPIVSPVASRLAFPSCAHYLAPKA